LARFAILEDNKIVNVIVADSKFIKENKINGVECGDEVSAGWEYIDKEFIAPAPILVQITTETTDGIA
jgi:hypothetical protein